MADIDFGRIKDFAQGLHEAEDRSVGDALKVAAAYLVGNYAWNTYKRNHK